MPSQQVAQAIAAKLQEDPAVLPSDLGVNGADYVPPATQGAGSVVLWIGLSCGGVLLAVGITVGYLKRVECAQAFRKVKRRARGWARQEDSYDENEGHVYRDEDQGGMVVSKTETTYELESVAEDSKATDLAGQVPDSTIQQKYIPSPKGEGAVLHMGIPTQNY